MVLELGEPKTSRQILVFVVVVVLVCWRHRRRRESRDKLTARVGKHPPHCHSAFSEEACRVAAAYIPRSSDVFIVTAPKTGTTFLQMLCHCVRTQGLTDFQDIYQVSPWDQLAWDLGQDLGDEPVSQPRLFKSHLRLASINRGAFWQNTFVWCDVLKMYFEAGGAFCATKMYLHCRLTNQYLSLFLTRTMLQKACGLELLFGNTT